MQNKKWWCPNVTMFEGLRKNWGYPVHLNRNSLNFELENLKRLKEKYDRFANESFR